MAAPLSFSSVRLYEERADNHDCMGGNSRRDTDAWWDARRLRYNIALVIAGIAAFILYLVALEVRCREVPGVEVTLFTTAFQGIGYLVAMGVANLCYTLGPALESRLGRRNVAEYRRTAYRAGLWFSVSLPFLVPAVIIAFGCQPGPA